MNIQFEQPFAEPEGPLMSAQPVEQTWVLDSDINGPLWYVSEASVPEEVAPGGVVDVEVEMSNERVFISPLHPNVCADETFSGLSSGITVDPEFAPAESTVVCTGLGGLTPATERASFDFPAPDSPGTYRVDITVVGTGDGVGGTVSYNVVVRDEADPRPDPTPEPPDNGGGGGGDGPLDGVLPDPGSPKVIAATGGVILLLLILLFVSLQG